MTCKNNCMHYAACKNEQGNTPACALDGNGLITYGFAEECKKFEDKELYIKLPCKVGDKIYCLYRNVIEQHTVEEFKVGNSAIWIHARMANGFPSFFSSTAIGHCAYLSLDEAVKALKEKDGEATDKQDVLLPREVSYQVSDFGTEDIIIND